MIGRLPMVLCAVALAWLLPGCGPGGDAPSRFAATRPEFRPEPGEAIQERIHDGTAQEEGEIARRASSPK